MSFTKKLVFLLIIPLLAFTVHKYYVSMTKIKYVKEKETVQITMRFFIDDIEKTLNTRFKKDFKLATSEEYIDTDKFLNLYIHQKFEYKINDQSVKYTFLGKEYDNDIVFFYLESTDIKNIKTIEVENKMLLELFEEQQNFIKLYINDQIKTMVLMRENDKEMLKY
jgi:hypothetical protein